MVSMPRKCSNPWCRLTPRQLELLERLAAHPGATNRQIARQMHVSERTVKKHFCDIYRAIGVQNRSECLVLLLRQGLAGGGPLAVCLSE
ncbi:MAG: response regulator transcription factor [Chloroflexi bacterium]|nr:response regulator transcription factor [Chloroflexota bacterium]